MITKISNYLERVDLNFFFFLDVSMHEATSSLQIQNIATAKLKHNCRQMTSKSPKYEELTVQAHLLQLFSTRACCQSYTP